jgi:hypothetical protein
MIFFQALVRKSPEVSMTSKISSMPYTTAAVFLIPELLEIVLSFLSFEDLLVADRVCKHWNEIMSASRILQRRLFLIGLPQGSSRKLDRSAPQPATSVLTAINHPEESTATLKVKLHPFLQNCLTKPLNQEQCVSTIPSGESIGRLVNLQSKRLKQMFVTQPPARRIKLRFYICTYTFWTPDSSSRAVIHWLELINPKGVNLGQVGTAVRQTLMHDDGAAVEVQKAVISCIKGGWFRILTGGRYGEGCWCQVELRTDEEAWEDSTILRSSQ